MTPSGGKLQKMQRYGGEMLINKWKKKPIQKPIIKSMQIYLFHNIYG